MLYSKYKRDSGFPLSRGWSLVSCTLSVLLGRYCSFRHGGTLLEEDDLPNSLYSAHRNHPKDYLHIAKTPRQQWRGVFILDDGCCKICFL